MRKRQYKLICKTCDAPFDGYQQGNMFCSKKCNANSEKKKEYTRQYTQNRRALLQKMKTDKGCELCGYNKHPEALDWDHLDQRTKKFNISQDPKKKWDTILEEIAKCRVLCRNCHAVETVERRHHAYRTGH